MLINVVSSPKIMPLKDIEELCQPHTDKDFFDLHNKVTLKGWQPSVVFDNTRRNIGRGIYGKVKKANYPDGEDIHESCQRNPAYCKELAIKRIEYKDSNEDKVLLELEILNALKESNQRPWFYGCVYNKFRDVYIVLEKLKSGLTLYSKHRKMLKFFYKKERMKFYLQIAKQLAHLFELGYIHGDIKFDNMVFDDAFENIYLIDFGLSQHLGDQLKFYGTPYFLSPDGCKAHFKTDLKVKPIDDLYSFAILIALTEADGNFQMIFGPEENVIGEDGKMYIVPLMKHDPIIKNMIRKNVMEILKGAGYAEPKFNEDSPSVETTNFAGLIWFILKYDNFPFQPEDVLTIFGNAITEEKRKAESLLPLTQMQKLSLGTDKKII